MVREWLKIMKCKDLSYRKNLWNHKRKTINSNNKIFIRIMMEINNAKLEN